MAVLFDKNTKVIFQGFTRSERPSHMERAVPYGARMNSCVPAKSGQLHLDLPVFNSVRKAQHVTEGNASMINTSAPFIGGDVTDGVRDTVKAING